jgi:hypothetical protein
MISAEPMDSCSRVHIAAPATAGQALAAIEFSFNIRIWCST